MEDFLFEQTTRIVQTTAPRSQLSLRQICAHIAAFHQEETYERNPKESTWEIQEETYERNAKESTW